MDGEEPPATRRWAPGAVVAGKYRVLGPLGEGGMGVVVRAQQVLSGQEVALKVLPTHRADRPEAVVRLLREARAVGQLRSQHTVRLFDTGLLDDGSPYLALELLDGQDLGRLLRSRRLSVAEAVGWVLQACEGLAEAHALGIVHRDLKPSNLFLAQEPGGARCLKVLDFGLARSLDEIDQGLTRSDGVLGSPRYMAPEQIRSARQVEARADLWALGVVLFELVSGRLPFESDSSSGVLAAIVADPPVPLRTFLPDAPDALVDALDRCLRKAPEERFASVSELARALAPLVASGVDAVARIERIRQVRASAPVADEEHTADPLSTKPSGSVSQQEISGVDGSFSLPSAQPRGSWRWALPVVGVVAASGILWGVGRWMILPAPPQAARSVVSAAPSVALAAPSLSAASAAPSDTAGAAPEPPSSPTASTTGPEPAHRREPPHSSPQRRVAASIVAGPSAVPSAASTVVPAPAATASGSTTGTRL